MDRRSGIRRKRLCSAMNEQIERESPGQAQPGKRTMENAKKDVKKVATEEEKIREVVEAVNSCSPFVTNGSSTAKAVETVTNLALSAYRTSMTTDGTDSDGNLDVAMAMYKIARNNYYRNDPLEEPLYVKIGKTISIYVEETGLELWNATVSITESRIKHCEEDEVAEMQQLRDDLLKLGPHGFARLYQPFDPDPDTTNIKQRVSDLHGDFEIIAL